MMLLWGGGYDANILMVSESGYQLKGIPGDDGQINYLTFEYAGTEEYNGKEYFKYVFTSTDFVSYILTPTRNITKVNFPFDDYHFRSDGTEGFLPFSLTGVDSLYGFTSVPENKILMKRRTDIGTNANGKDYVDLGLTSGTLWATMNVGATSETDEGSYFQWGDTEDKRNAECSWSTYKHCNGTADTTDENVKFTKYNALTTYGENPDGKITLDLEDDAARVHMGGDWRIPSLALMEELISETKNEWTLMGGKDGGYGWKFTSRTDESKYIFIPHSYHREGNVTTSGSQFWSSSLNASNPIHAGFLYLGSNRDIGASYSDYAFTGNNRRCFGYTVRGVL